MANFATHIADANSLEGTLLTPFIKRDDREITISRDDRETTNCLVTIGIS